MYAPQPSPPHALLEAYDRADEPAFAALAGEGFALDEDGDLIDREALIEQLRRRTAKGSPPNTRGSRVLPDDFDWYWLIGDESALPAIGRRVEELRAGVPVTSVVAIADPAERQTFSTRAAWQACWVERGEPGPQDAQQLLAAVRLLPRPTGDGYVWIAGEASIARALRAYVQGELGHPRAWLRAAGYWQRGHSGAHVELGD